MDPSADIQSVNFGKSIIVPSVQELAKKAISQIPPRYVHHHQDYQPLSDDQLQYIPIIDVHKLSTDESELERLHSACKNWGFFQVVNHGISISLMEEFKFEIENFFKLPYEEKKNLWQQPHNQEGFGQLFVVSEEQNLDWSDMFYITTLPHNIRKTDLVEKLPSNLRENLELYSVEAKTLAMTLLSYMARALKMDAEEMRKMFSDGVQSMRMNYYPVCAEPDKAIGFSPHSDADALTIVYQLNETEGLQIRKDRKWVPVKPLPNAFVVNIGDIMEILSNGIYRSIEHRAVVNSTKERLSIATFYSCNLNAEIGPALNLTGPTNPPKFRGVTFEKYAKDFFSLKLQGKAYLDILRIKHEHYSTHPPSHCS